MKCKSLIGEKDFLRMIDSPGFMARAGIPGNFKTYNHTGRVKILQPRPNGAVLFLNNIMALKGRAPPGKNPVLFAIYHSASGGPGAFSPGSIGPGPPAPCSLIFAPLVNNSRSDLRCSICPSRPRICFACSFT